MLVFHTQLHIITFLIILLEMVFFCHQIIYYLSRPSDKNRFYFLILLYLLIQHNLIGGLLPDTNIPIPIILQNITAYAVAFAMAFYFPFYFYKAFRLSKMKFYAYWGSTLFLIGPFLLFFIVPYYLTGDFALSRKLAMIIPFFYTLSFLYSLKSSIIVRNKELNVTSKNDILGMYIAVILFGLLPLIAFFETNLNVLLVPILHFHNGSQVVEVLTTNSGLLVMTILFIRQTVRQSKEEYQQLQDSEKALKELNSELIIKVKERTKELELANEKRTNSFVNLAHETKTPLTLINNYLEEYIIKHGKTKELEIIKNSLGKLSKDIVNFFDLERMNKGFNVYNHDQHSNFSTILKGSLTLFKQYAIKKNIAITDSIEDELFIKADPESVYRIINNLIENAIKYTQANGEIELILKSNNGNIHFSVKDNGIGISPDLHNNVFDPYYQINSQKSNFQGMGLGLSIVKKIVASLQGTVTLNSDPANKVGTEIIIHFPQYSISNNEIVAELENTKTYLEIEHLSIAEQVYDAHKPAIMIVEDNISLLNFIVEKLQEKYNIYYALNGWEALEKLKTVKHLDILISDVMMDKGDGFELYKDISSQVKFRHIPVIFITAKTTSEDKIQGLSLGAIDYIFKPFLICELTSKIDSVLNNLSQQREALINQAYNSLISDRYESKEISSGLNKFEENCNRFHITTREKEIIKLIKMGKTYKEIADNLCISDKTVAKHLQNIFEKVNVTNKLELLGKLEASIFA